jgi:hypothetical protein
MRFGKVTGHGSIIGPGKMGRRQSCALRSANVAQWMEKRKSVKRTEARRVSRYYYAVGCGWAASSNEIDRVLALHQFAPHPPHHVLPLLFLL